MIEYENLQKVNEKLFAQYQESFQDFLSAGWYVLGRNVSKFEDQFSAFCGSKHCVGVSSGLDALILAIDAFDFPSGSEIIVPSNTYIATILAIIRNGFKPVLVEPDISTYNINAAIIKQSITKKTAAILVVHLYGKPCLMDKIVDIANEYSLEIIEDCAQAHGAMFQGQKVGSFGVGCFSFYPTKNLGSLGDSGAITCSNTDYKEKLKSLRNYGSKKKYYNDDLGYNSRLDEIQAGFLLIKLGILDEINSHKRKLARIYLDQLDDRFIKPFVSESTFDVYHIFNIRTGNRDDLKRYLLSHNILTEIHYPVPPHQQKSMRGIIDGEYPISEEIHNTTLSLPISYCLDEEDICRVCETINQWNC